MSDEKRRGKGGWCGEMELAPGIGKAPSIRGAQQCGHLPAVRASRLLCGGGGAPLLLISRFEALGWRRLSRFRSLARPSFFRLVR
ncbi:hypothetical protein MTO96_051058 [Rhipicephalus appendiculatus]